MFKRESGPALAVRSRGVLGWMIAHGIRCGALLCGALTVPALSMAEFAPKIHLVTPEFDFGAVVEGTSVRHVFSIQNVGNGELQIQRVVPSCGCTASAASVDRVAPGKTADVTVDFDTSGFAGEKVKAVRVYTNDAERPVTMLTLRGTVQPLVTVTPDRLALGELAQGSPVERDIEVQVRAGSGLKVGKIQAFSPTLSVNSFVVKDGKASAKVKFSADVPLGEFRDRIVVTLDGKTPRSVNVPIFAVVTGDLKLTPPTVSFGLLEGEGDLVRTVRLQHRGSSPLGVPEVRSSHAGVRAVVKAIQPGKEFEIEIRVNPKDVRKDLKAALEIVASGAVEKRVTLSVFGVLPPKV